MSTTTRGMDDRRSTLVAAGLVAAVVVVLGFGSGFWSDLARSTGAIAAPSGHDLGTVVQPGPVALGVTSGGSGATTQPISSVRDAAPASPSTTPASAAHHDTTTTTSAPGTTTTVVPGPPATPASACSAGVIEPFWVHFEKAHLETSVGQQLHDALSVDQYVKTHTVLLEAMLTPIVQAVMGDGHTASPFWTHLTKAHLETSPGDQVAQALSLDQYVKTHTVLVEDMVSPILGLGC